MVPLHVADVLCGGSNGMVTCFATTGIRLWMPSGDNHGRLHFTPWVVNTQFLVGLPRWLLHGKTHRQLCSQAVHVGLIHLTHSYTKIGRGANTIPAIASDAAKAAERAGGGSAARCRGHQGAYAAAQQVLLLQLHGASLAPQSRALASPPTHTLCVPQPLSSSRAWTWPQPRYPVYQLVTAFLTRWHAVWCVSTLPTFPQLIIGCGTTPWFSHDSKRITR